MRFIIVFLLASSALVHSASALASGTINFTEIMPPEFEFCGKKVARGSTEYDALWGWFNNNTTGWYESKRQYELDLVYTSATMRVNLKKTRVIVSYAGAGSVGQVVKAAKTAGFNRLCN